MKTSDSLTRFVASFVDELTRLGVNKAVISPGSRSTPLAMLMAEHPKLSCYMNIDERSAGFFALGLAKEKKKPVVLVCTSGTAAANYYPAIVEARYARVPLIVLTADRPHELRDVGAPQAIDQVQMYGNYPKWFVDVALPEEEVGMYRYVRTIAGRAFAISASHPAGVVHLNFPFREPLIPNLSLSNLWEAEDDRLSYLHTIQGLPQLEKSQIKDIADIMKGIAKGLIICGEQNDSEFISAVKEMSGKLKYPILADPLSQLRSGKSDKQGIIEGYDSILKDPEMINILKPELIIRFGPMPVSKPLMLMLKNNPDITQIIVDPSEEYRDPTLNAAHMIVCNHTKFCEDLSEILEECVSNQFYNDWILSNTIYQDMIEHELGQINDLFEGKIVRELQHALPDGSCLVVGSSMPIRDVDTFFRNTDKEIRVLANRGANGIDGVVSTALGISAVSIEPAFLLIGDLSFFHDFNGLLAAKMNNLDLTIILVNNDGGGIFSFLPQSKEEKHFETLYGTPIGIDFSKVVDMYQGEYEKINSWDELHTYFRDKWSNRGLKVIEIETNRTTRVNIHRELLDHVSQEIRKVLKQ
ncbi:2-succinyl-5-enolpyruvyl-6-hydroxy-3-cyclohexene-1-carboxylic-acid synthase [Metabacillus halosaccharovorans]|uniref:2-succinyl-5-enolpyruvyl-6-hydroxy-3- cyclohexene-1-carboxylic-acid synthase n=1 Tax=Metabacillus halosaccharovorans TaxID=930124 RepID=UPI0020414D4F|nr:2-succinyl-5-enolpyruvyl-6-hydroxy-3-cyclohexene-1-carboxylic-acid synthase [Metabacillus halosaccharovorans]MCM3444425.1 2-succinyl-5-enolpyruvyl-6-hydroxy-3-cyclohexene-1-carboxylic-acid synthase [Metabacillus halosaccharovorans]